MTEENPYPYEYENVLLIPSESEASDDDQETIYEKKVWNSSLLSIYVIFGQSSSAYRFKKLSKRTTFIFQQFCYGSNDSLKRDRELDQASDEAKKKLMRTAVLSVIFMVN